MSPVLHFQSREKAIVMLFFTLCASGWSVQLVGAKTTFPKKQGHLCVMCARQTLRLVWVTDGRLRGIKQSHCCWLCDSYWKWHLLYFLYIPPAALPAFLSWNNVFVIMRVQFEFMWAGNIQDQPQKFVTSHYVMSFVFYSHKVCCFLSFPHVTYNSPFWSAVKFGWQRNFSCCPDKSG